MNNNNIARDLIFRNMIFFTEEIKFILLILFIIKLFCAACLLSKMFIIFLMIITIAL